MRSGDELDDRDRDDVGGSSGRFSRRRLPDDDAAGSAPAQRRRPIERGDEFGGERPGERRFRGERERTRPDQDSTSRPARDPGRSRPPRREDASSEGWSSERFRRAGREHAEDVDDRSSRASRDPYDRLRRVSNRPARRVEVDPYDELSYEGDDDEYLTPVQEPRRRSSRAGTRAPAHGVRQQQLRQVGTLMANPSAELRPIMAGALVSIVSLVLLSIVLLLRAGDLGAWNPIRLNAEGDPTVFGTPSAAWRLPVFALFSTIMALGLGWWLRAREPFAAQFLAVGALLIHGLIWVSAITLLW